ncbi:MAG: adenine phosphoribosyltransferase [Leptospiraceae bacterium]|nr:adenine phosphoribosyltransferase [Leptospiraceae bacterium]MDW7976717.1 adenine phosphoribosyltransferase [Leptospiraceae bacterium]
MHSVTADYIKTKIRTIPNWPKEGVMFRDITPLFQDPKALRGFMDAFVQRYIDKKIDVVAGIDARGFLIGVGIAYALNVSFVPIRKKGKLPWKTISQEYELEYGKEEIEIHIDACKKGDRVVIIDDLIATGGTMLAGIELIRRLGGEVVEVAAIVDLPDLGGSKKIQEQAKVPVFTICEFEGH